MAGKVSRRHDGRRGGRKAKLPGLKVVGGKNFKPLKDAAAEDDIMTPPAFLNIHGQQIWMSAVRILTIIGEMSPDHVYGLHELAHTWQRHVKKMEADQDIEWRDRETFRKQLIEYGLTPASRQRLDPQGRGRVKPNRFTDQPSKEKQLETDEPSAQKPSRFAAMRAQVHSLITPETTEKESNDA